MLLAVKTNDEKSIANFAVCKIISKVFRTKAEIIHEKNKPSEEKILMSMEPAEEKGVMRGYFES